MMNCRYCDAEIKEGSLFCDRCGQAIESSKDIKQNIEFFWQKENNQKQQDVIEQLSSLKEKSEQLQSPIALGRKYKSKKHFFRIMFVLLLICIASFVFAVYKSTENPSELYFSLYIASVVTVAIIVIIITYATMIIKKGSAGVFYPLIPVYGLFYFLYSIFCGIKRLFAPLEKSEDSCSKELKIIILELGLLKKEEKNLKQGLSLVDKNILKNPSLQNLRKPIVIDKKRINGWQVATAITVVIVVSVFVLSYYLAPWIINNVLNWEGWHEMSLL